MKRIIVFIAIFVLTISTAFADEFPKWVNFANDYAATLSQETEAYINEKGKSFQEQNGTEIVAVVIESLEGMPIEDYAFDLFNKWGVGDKKEDKGVLILLSVGDREIRVEVGDGMEGILNDAKVGRLIDNLAIPHFAENDFDSGIKALYDGIVEIVIDPEAYDDENDEEEEEAGTGSIIFSAIIVIIFLLAIFKSKKNGGGNDGDSSDGGFVSRGGHFGGGHFGGGRSSGGGFGGFGGGSSSGGGASRKF